MLQRNRQIQVLRRLIVFFSVLRHNFFRRTNPQRLQLVVVLILLFSTSFFLWFAPTNRKNSQTTLPFTIAYFIQASKSNVALVPRLFDRLCTTSNTGVVFALHLDASICDRGVHHIKSKLFWYRRGCRIIWVLPREHVTYRGISITHNYLSAATSLIRARVHFDYLINLSAADYPTVSTAFIGQLLSRTHLYRLSFFDWQHPEKWHRFARGRLMRRFVDTTLVSAFQPDEEEAGQYITPPDDVSLPDTAREYINPLFEYISGWDPAKSSGWFIWHRSLVEHLLLDHTARKMLAAYTLSDASDEHYFASVVWNNGNLRQRTIPSNLRAVFFNAPNGSAALADDGVTRSKQHPYFVDDTDENGQPLFWESLKNSPAFFTRKIHPSESKIADNIDQHLLAKEGTDRRKYETLVENELDNLLRQHLLSQPELAGNNSDNFRSVFSSE